MGTSQAKIGTATYFVGLTTVTLPPKLISLFEERPAKIAAATAPPAANNRAARAPPLSPGIGGRDKRVQRVPGCGVPAVPVVPAAIAVVVPTARNSTMAPC